MYKIEKRSSGYILSFSGKMDANEMQRWFNDSQRNLTTEIRPSFGVIIDMRDLQPLSADAKDNMIAGQKLYKEKGMNKSAVILNSGAVCQQFKNLALISGIYKTERYIDASQIENAIDVAIRWVKDDIDPDKLN